MNKLLTRQIKHMLGKDFDINSQEQNIQDFWSGRVKYKVKKAQVFDLNTAIFPILNAKNEISQYMGIYQDISDIEKSRQKALELDKAKSLFIANMSHELRTPLNSIIGFSQLLRREDKLPEKLRSYIEKINFSGEHLLKLINSILDFSKIDAGEVKLEYKEIDLYAILSTTLTQQETQAKQKNIALNLEYADNLSRYFLGDSLRLTQIVTNLLSNAIKFTHEGSVKILASRPSKDRVQIQVKDTGIGLDESIQSKLFQEFAQADNSTSREYGGTGLGLSISKELVELMDGKIWVRSKQGKGSSFIFEIALKEIEKAPLEVEDVLYDEAVALEKLHSILNKEILLVEDNRTNQILISSLLEESSIKIFIANNGLEALEMIDQRKKPFDAILMDLQMPIMNGYEATIQIRRNDKTVPIIALSANILPKDMQKAKAIGMNQYLSKPLDTNKFYSYLLKYLSL